MKSRYWWVGVALLLATGSVRAAGEAPESGLERSADKLLVGIPVTAFALTFLLADPLRGGTALGFDFVHMTGSPRHDLGLALLRAGTVTYGLKYTVDERRPNGEDGSFPSGHTATTFAAAEFIRKEYGWTWGTPAYVAASFVGWSRVETKDHWWHDVAAGATIGILSNYDLGGLDTRWGALSLKPALFHGGPAAMPGAPEVPETAPGLKLEFRF